MDLSWFCELASLASSTVLQVQGNVSTANMTLKFCCVFSSNRLRLPWNKTVSQGGLASLASSIIKKLHGNISTVSMEVITSNKGGQKILLNGYMYTKKVTRLTGIWWSCVCARTLGCKGTVITSLVVDKQSRSS